MAKRKQKTGNLNAWTAPEVIKIVGEMIKYASENITVNTLLSVCVHAQINNDCICDWEKKFHDIPDVLRIIKELRQMMEARLIERALNNETNPGFTKFLLQAKMGYQIEQGNVTIIKGDKINISFDDDSEEEAKE